MNKTSLKHPSVLKRIAAAMRLAMLTGCSQYLYNKHGEPFMRITYKRNQANAFSFFGVLQKNLTALVLSVLRGEV